MNDRTVNAYSSANEVLVSVNPAAAAFLGKTTSELQGKRISELGLPPR